MLNPEVFSLSREVEDALAAGRAVVALESTVVAHGLPRPQNLETALRLEQIVRDAGAVPATVAVIRGTVRVGLDRAALEHVANHQPIHKLSTRDLPVALARKLDGATTVATTALLAALAGLSVFATGGIGGVHRGALPDVSADLPELARTKLAAVVCSGAKVVLDLPATREWLETHGVTVVGYGCDEMPAFYTRASGLPVDVRADTPAEVAALARAHRALDLAGALLVTVPVPAEAEVPREIVEDALASALEEAARAEVAGRDLTPFLLKRLADESGGATLRANVALLERNARVAAEIAVALTSHG